MDFRSLRFSTQCQCKDLAQMTNFHFSNMDLDKDGSPILPVLGDVGSPHFSELG